MMGLAALRAPASETASPQLRTAAISTDDCRRLMRRNRVPGADFVPGVDAHGKPVARAELNGPSSKRILDSLEIVIESDLAAAPGLTPSQEAEARIGVITIDNTGIAYLNGQRLTADATGLLESKCQQVVDP
ncbi:MAG: hypothetical protein H6905_02420 [Hyphomicrobiales bacterium]|nr:hypothetical protein [Hyphomicrobiales bacterium]